MGTNPYTLCLTVPQEETNLDNLIKEFNSNWATYQECQGRFDDLSNTDNLLSHKEISSKFFENLFFNEGEGQSNSHLSLMVSAIIADLEDPVSWPIFALRLYPFLHYEVEPLIIPNYSSTFFKLICAKCGIENNKMRHSKLELEIFKYFSYIVLGLSTSFDGVDCYSVKKMMGEKYETVYCFDAVKKLAEDFMRGLKTKSEIENKEDILIDAERFNKFATKGEKNWYISASQVRILFYLSHKA